MFSSSMDAGFVLALPFHHGDLEPDRWEFRPDGGLMCGIKIPLQDFELEMQGVGGLMREAGRICGTLRYLIGSLVASCLFCLLFYFSCS